MHRYWSSLGHAARAVLNALRLHWVGPVDVALLLTAVGMVVGDATDFFFHIMFMFLAIGAFSWKFRQFIPRALFWVPLTTGIVGVAVFAGKTQPEELIEIPLLTLILLLIVYISQ